MLSLRPAEVARKGNSNFLGGPDFMTSRHNGMQRGLGSDPRYLLLVPTVGAFLCLVYLFPSRLDGSLTPGNMAGLGRLQSEVIQGHDVLWQLPDAEAKGLVFFAHGCNHQATDLWTQADCDSLGLSCLGLPEDVRVRKEALRHGYAFIAISSLDRRGRRCWDVKLDPTASVDGKHVAEILGTVRQRKGLEQAPLYALGASSGAAFVLMLPHLVPDLQGICAEIMGVPPELLTLGSGRPYPPTLFVHMPRDEHTHAAVQADMQALRAAGVHAAEIQVTHRPVTAEFLSSRAPQISRDMAAGIVKVLREGGILAADGKLLKDPRRTHSKWQGLLQQHVPGMDQVSLVPDESPVTELLNLAWASHEIVSDFTGVALTWLAAGGKADINRLIQQEQQRGWGD